MLNVVSDIGSKAESTSKRNYTLNNCNNCGAILVLRMAVMMPVTKITAEELELLYRLTWPSTLAMMMCPRSVSLLCQTVGSPSFLSVMYQEASCIATSVAVQSHWLSTHFFCGLSSAAAHIQASTWAVWVQNVKYWVLESTLLLYYY